MTRPIVLAGGGLAAQRCAETLRRGGYDGPIVMVCAEPVPPYDRPPLSKELLAGEVSEEGIRLRPDAWYADNQVELLLDSPATGFDAHSRELLIGERRLAFHRLVIATGAHARSLGAGLTLRDAADTRTLRDRLSSGARLVIVGGGLIGQEVAATAVGHGAQVAVVERAAAPMAAILGEEVGRLLGRMHRNAGVQLECGIPVEAVHADRVDLADGRSLHADVVLVAVGGVPATAWLAGSPLAADRPGIAVDARARTTVPHVYAAGDCASPGGPGHDHWESAARQGTNAARSILGLPVAAAPPHSFWSDQHGVRLHVLGEPWTAARVLIEGDIDAHDLGVRYFAADGRLVGALLVGRGREMPAVRRQLTHHTTIERKAA